MPGRECQPFHEEVWLLGPLLGRPQLFGESTRQVVGVDHTSIIEDLQSLDLCFVCGQVLNLQRDQQCCWTGTGVERRLTGMDQAAYKQDICGHAVENPGFASKINEARFTYVNLLSLLQNL